MRLPENSWPDTDGARGALFFAQQMREMLTPQTSESFRAMSLDTIARLRECRRVLGDFERGAISDATIEPFLQELEWSLKQDPVASLQAPRLCALFSDKLHEKKVPSVALIPVVDALFKSLNTTYKSSIEEGIIATFTEKDRRQKLKSLTSFYCSHLLNKGYSRPYVLECVRTSFFTRPMVRVGAATLNAFFNKFHGQQKQFHVYLMTDRRFANPISRIGATSYRFGELPAHVQSAFSSEPRDLTTRWIGLNASALDVYGAGDLVEYMLNSAQSINFLGPQITGYTWSKKRFVTTQRSTGGVMIVPPSAERVQHRRRIGIKSSPVKFANTIKTVTSQLDEHSTSRLLNSLNTGDISGRHITRETRLISLWSAVEVLLSDPPKGTARILHYERSIMPCICLRYMRRNVSAVYEEMREIYKQRFVKIIKSEPDFPNHDSHTRFAFVLMKKSNKALRDKLLNLCSDNPLALYRLFRVWKDCSTPTEFDKAIRDHETRVRWQIYRIYRARNTLVHAGSSPSYLSSLVQNIFDYYKASVWTILSHVKSEEKRSNLKDAVSEIGINYEIFKSHLFELRNNNEFTDDEIMLFMHTPSR